MQKRIEGKRQLNKFRRLRADGCRVTFVGADEARGPRTNRTPLETTPGLVSRHALFPPTLALKKKKKKENDTQALEPWNHDFHACRPRLSQKNVSVATTRGPPWAVQHPAHGAVSTVVHHV